MRIIVYLTALAIIFGVVRSEEECPNKGKESSHHLFDQDFGLALTANDLLTSMMSPWITQDYFRPWRNLETLTRDFGSTIKTEKDLFTINLDVQHFSPNEISVKTADGYVVIEAKHEEKKDDHGSVSRHFVRKYALPEGVESDDVVSKLSSDGILSISAPRKEVDNKGERTVPITQTGPVRKESKEESSGGSCSAEGKCNH